MSFTLLIIGAVLLIAAVKNTQGSLFTLVQGDFTGPNNFVYWTLSILLIGAIGYIPKLKPFSVAFLILVILVLILTKGNPNSTSGGFFQKFFQQIGSTTTAKTGAATATVTQPAVTGLSQLVGP